MKYVALLRGINVGGNAKVDMSRLKNVFEALGCVNVKTYINSGNVLFTDNHSIVDLIKSIETAIQDEFGFTVPVILRTADNIKAVCSYVPKTWTNDIAQRTDVMFLWDEIDNEDIMQMIIINPKLENVIYSSGALIWNIARENVTRGAGIKLIKSDVYKHMTVRNINTVRKLNELLGTS